MQKMEIGKSPAFRFYAADFVTDTQSWTAEEVGVYVRLLCSEWINGSIPPMSDEDGTANGKPMAEPMAQPMADAKQMVSRLARIAGITEDQLLRVWPQVGGKFSKGEDGNLYNSRLEHERGKQIAYRNEKSKAGAAGAEKRWNAARISAQADSTANGTAIVLPLANGIANDGGSFSSSSSFSKKEKSSASRASDNTALSPYEKEDREAEERHKKEKVNSWRIWRAMAKVVGGAEILDSMLGPKAGFGGQPASAPERVVSGNPEVAVGPTLPKKGDVKSNESV